MIIVHMFDMFYILGVGGMRHKPLNLVSGEIFNVGAENYTVDQLAKFVVESIGSDVAIKRTTTDDNRSYRPHWVPRLWVMVGNRQADSVVELWVSAEPSVLSEHVDSWSFLRILIWASDLTNVESSLASLGVLETEDDEVPRVDVFRVWKTDEIVSDLTVLFDLGVVIFLSHFGFSLESHLTSFGSSFSLHCFHGIVFFLKI